MTKMGRCESRPSSTQPEPPTGGSCVRVAVTASGLAGALGGALYGFAGVSPTMLVAGAAVTGLAIGCHLPPVRP